MSKTFRPWNIDQRWLLPPSVDEFVPVGHIAHFVRDTVRTGLDLSAFLSSYGDERGYPPCEPTMMTGLLVYAYSQGVYSSRRIVRACEERLDFMAVTALNRIRAVELYQQRIQALHDARDLVGMVNRQQDGMIWNGPNTAPGSAMTVATSRATGPSSTHSCGLTR